MSALRQKFTEPIECIISNDGKFFQLTKGFVYYRKTHKAVIEQKHYSADEIVEFGTDCVLVPKNFRSDGFTNFGLDFLVRKYGKGLKCAILHDFLCDCARDGKNTRKFADEVFLEAMLETGAFCKVKAYFLYFCVRFYAVLKRLK